ncbi:glycosyltransferase family protein [Formosa haliotis]|uniref:glycosyltransferase family protein n=1 Tax=Formosa haliotis TaxID=1555194 RepID=UPI000826A451|nr:glycosyltransferase [Formosa haliotis]
MKILLIGEFSRLHNSLKEGLEQLGHEVIIIGTGDLFKKYPVDIDLTPKVSQYPLFKLVRKVGFKLSKFDLSDLEVYYNFNRILPTLKDFDVIQLINEDPLNIHPNLEIKLLKKLFKTHHRVFLLSCGDDFTSVSHYLTNTMRYSVLTPYLENKSLGKQFQYSLKYVSAPYKKLHDFLLKHCKGVIASDLDYHIPLANKSFYLGLIPNPINTDLIHFTPLKIDSKINIFLGVNTLSQAKKGIAFFKAALAIIAEKYPEQVDIHITENIPYAEYIKLYNNAHIVLDQVYAYDQGYNALEAMAKGKVVFTGAEQEWLDYYNLEENTVAINALPDVNYLVEKLSWLICNPDIILKISKNARTFIEKEHFYKTIAKNYLSTWEHI